MKSLLLPLVLGTILLTGMSAGATPAIVEAHGIATTMSDGQPVETATRVSPDDVVIAWARVGEAAGGETLRWQFNWPTGNSSNVTATVADDGYYHAEVDLDRYQSRHTVGDWSVTLYLNEAIVATDTFTVEPLGGLLWWGPLLGAALLIAFLAVVGYIGYRLVRRFSASSTHE